MTEKIFCYCCRVHHPVEEMQAFQTRQGVRWRCRRSIEAARREIELRDAFGRAQSEINRLDAVACKKHLPAFLAERQLTR